MVEPAADKTVHAAFWALSTRMAAEGSAARATETRERLSRAVMGLPSARNREVDPDWSMVTDVLRIAVAAGVVRPGRREVVGLDVAAAMLAVGRPLLSQLGRQRDVVDQRAIAGRV